MIFVLNCLRTHPRQVATGVGLGHRYGENNIPTYRTGYVAVDLFFAAKTGDVGRHDATVERAKPVTATRICQLLDNDLLPANIVVIHATKALLRPNHEEPLFTGFLENLSIDDSLLAEPLHVRHDFFSEKTSVRLPEHGLLFCKLPSEHDALLRYLFCSRPRRPTGLM